jgi:Uma2 family endonuclease
MVRSPVKLTFEEYLQYDDRTDNRYELEDGKLVLMPPPSPQHSNILQFIVFEFVAEIRRLRLPWTVRWDAGIRTRLSRSRVPDLLVMEGNVWLSIQGQSQAVLDGLPVLLAIEIVSPGSENRRRDYEDKVTEYAQCDVAEYWIVDPIEERITILTLMGGNYNERVYRNEEAIASPTFPNLSLNTSQILNPPLY